MLGRQLFRRNAAHRGLKARLLPSVTPEVVNLVLKRSLPRRSRAYRPSLTAAMLVFEFVLSVPYHVSGIDVAVLSGACNQIWRAAATTAAVPFSETG